MSADLSPSGATRRYAVFIDAAYLWSSLGVALFGVADRSQLRCDHETLVRALVQRTGVAAGRELLRVYWYDGAVNKVPTPDQRRFGQVDDLKLRLGRVVGGHRKGVDSLIVLDLLRLATTRAVDTIYLFSGDDDLTEGVREAQALGVRVILLGVEGQVQRQAESLVLEADRVELWEVDFWRSFVHLGAALARRGDEEAEAEQAAGEGGALRTFEQVGVVFAQRWRGAASEHEIAQVRRSKPRIPSELDARLLWESSAGRELSEGERVALRGGFWRGLDQPVPAATGDAAEPPDSSTPS